MARIKWFYDGERASVLKTERPSCRRGFGRAWDAARVTVNGKGVESLVDWTWGHWVYFKYRNQWYKVDMHVIGGDPDEGIHLTCDDQGAN